MKKAILIPLAIIVSIGCFAQKQTTKIVLTGNQSLKFTSTIKGNISQEALGQSMDMDIDVVNHKNILVKSVDKEKYKIDFTTTRLKSDISLMGTSKKFDSDNKEDMNGEMKDFGKDINVVKPFELGCNNSCISTDSIAKSSNTASKNADLMSGMIDQLMGSGNDEATIESYFMLLPTDKKLGDSWTDSLISGDIKKYTTYKWDSLQNNIAVLTITEKIINNIKTEMMGMDISTNIVNDVAEARKVDIKTGVIIERKSTVKMNGSADIMGMSVPVTGTVITSITSE
ncbi:DUF6263 family protein [Ferruginibacter lapsinanis]|uniref:DUF6263 family protein n=1 Tax=Ferruginibacter lapsinanis TaxID=563172 RepID=UPI001E4D3323|nr:DUF6263 family protein [Ferruginibacter lapsinanis]UEG50152.1 DUF6263 family protein [Ferruginibacter lapsinanis]